MQVRTDLLRAKLIETPWLGRINHMSMVASKAARVVDAARGKPVLEFGARRTHPGGGRRRQLRGLAGRLRRHLQPGGAARATACPSPGTMDHFFVQADRADRRAVARERARGVRAVLSRAFPHNSIMLVDTYDTEARHPPRRRGHRRQAAPACASTRTSRRRRWRGRAQLLDELGAPHAKIFVSDGLDELRVRRSSTAPTASAWARTSPARPTPPPASARSPS